METMKLYPALLSMQNLFILTCFCPPSCGHSFSDSSFMLELIQTILQERQNNIKTAMIITHYRQPRHQLPEFLLGTPRQVQATCIGNMEKAKEIKNDSIIFMETDGCYGIKCNSCGTHTVDICNGACTCKVLLYNRYLANTCLQCFHNQI